MKSNRTLCIVLAAVMLLSLGACGAAPASSAPQESQAPQEAAPAPAPAEAAAPAPDELPLSDTDKQLALIQSKISTLLQPEGDQPWLYTVTDLDHNGRLEFVAARQHPQDRSKNLLVWEVNTDRSALSEVAVKLEEDETFPDFMTDSTDTYHMAVGDTWSYMFYDNIVLSDTEVFTRKSAMTFKNGTISYEPFAIEHTVVTDGTRNVSYLDGDGNDITQDEYNASGVTAFAGAERSSTGFEWLKADEVQELDRLGSSWMVFTGLKKAPETNPFPTPAALQQPAATPAPAPTAEPTATPAPTPAPTPVPDPGPTYLTITKNPTNEPGKKEGGTALFVACANAFDSLTWTMVSPSGAEYTPQQFAQKFPSVSVSGYYGTTLSLANLVYDVGGWGAYCTFYYRGQSARTSTAYVYVKYAPAPSEGYVNGSVYDWNYGYVSVMGDDGRSVTVDWNHVSLTGDIVSGAPATYYWSGSKDNITICYIEGQEKPVGPVYGSMSGRAYEGGGGYAIDLDNGTQVFVDSWNCKVEGNFYDGCSAVVYYMNYPSTDNVYHADIYGNQGLIVPTRDDDQGGWAGSHYYDNEPGFQVADPSYVDQGTYGYETDNSVPVAIGESVFNMTTHISYNDDGSTYEAIWCPNCGAEVSLAMDHCPVCGRGF